MPIPFVVLGVVAIKSAIKAGAVIGAKAAAKAATVAAAKAAAKAATVAAAKAATKTATVAAAKAAAASATKTATIAAATQTAAATGATKTAAAVAATKAAGATTTAKASLGVSTVAAGLGVANKIRDDNKPPSEPVKVEVKVNAPSNPNAVDPKGNDAKQPDSTQVASSDVAEKDISETDQVDQSSADVAETDVSETDQVDQASGDGADKDVNETDQDDSDSAAKDVGQDDPSIDAIAGLEQAEALDSRTEGQIGDVSSTGLDDVNNQPFVMNDQASERDVLTGQTGQNTSSSADAVEGLFTTKDPLTGMDSNQSSDSVTALQDSDRFKEPSAWGSGQADLRGLGTSLEARSLEADFMLQKQQINPMKLDVVSLLPSDQSMADPTQAAIQASDPMQPQRQDQFQQQREPVLA